MALLSTRPRLRTLLVMGLIGSVFGCSDQEVLGLRDDMFAVHALLVAGADTANVRVTRTDPTLPLGEELVIGAEVRLIRHTDTIDLVLPLTLPTGPAALAVEYQGLVPGGIAPGDTFDLVVLLPDGAGTVHGRTAVVRPPAIDSPSPGYRATVGGVATVPLQVRAEGSPGGIRHFRARTAFTAAGPMADPTCEFSEPEDPDQPPTDVSDWAVLEIPAPECRTDSGGPLDWDSMDVDLTVLVFDSAYVQYARALFGSAGGYRPNLGFGIEGAMGFLASAADSSTVIRLLNAP